MREILFRGKRCDNGEWVQGFYVRADHHWHKNGIHKDWIALGASANGGWFALHNKYAVKKESISQFTGLTDKNGKKIFEGDVVKVLQGKDKGIACVGFENGAFMLYPQTGNIYERTLWEYWYNDWEVEIIGNIHDNPELLENS